MITMIKIKFCKLIAYIKNACGSPAVEPKEFNLTEELHQCDDISYIFTIDYKVDPKDSRDTTK